MSSSILPWIVVNRDLNSLVTCWFWRVANTAVPHSSGLVVTLVVFRAFFLRTWDMWIL